MIFETLNVVVNNIMTRFLDYICESHFSNADYSKHNGKYISAVLDTITTKGYIGLGNEKVEKKVAALEKAKEALQGKTGTIIHK